MKRTTVILSIVFCGAAVIGQGQTPATQPDNTKVNKRDRQPGAVTADQQKENPTDRALSQKVRQSIMADKSLSTNAHNIKIISQNGTVTLKGPVQSAAEKQSVIAKAVVAAGGADKVTDQISIKQ